MARPRSSGRVKQWSATLGTFEVDGLASARSLGDSQTFQAFEEPATLLRVRGTGSVQMVPGAANDVKLVGLGLIIVSDQAAAAGAASCPSPLDDPEDDWLWHNIWMLRSQTGTIAEASLTQVYQYAVDSKAMRKIRGNESLVFVADGDNVSGTPTADIAATYRLLALQG